MDDGARGVAAEIEAKQRAERRQILTDAEALESLVKHPGWSRYIALVESVAQNYYATVMKPMESVLEVTKIEHAKGVLNGLSLASTLPGMKIKEAHELRRPTEDDE